MSETTIIKVANEDIEIWPRYCTRRKQNCTQCQFEGKILCSPNHRATATLPLEGKIAIAEEAKKRGVLTVAKEKNIPMFMVRAWVGAYCRKNSKRYKTTPPAEKPAPVAPPQRLDIAPITMVEVIPGDCTICERGILQDGVDSEHNLFYIDSPSGRLGLCWVCAEGIKRVFDALGIPCLIKKEKNKNHGSIEAADQ